MEQWVTTCTSTRKYISSFSLSLDLVVFFASLFPPLSLHILLVGRRVSIVVNIYASIRLFYMFKHDKYVETRESCNIPPCLYSTMCATTARGSAFSTRAILRIKRAAETHTYIDRIHRARKDQYLKCRCIFVLPRKMRAVDFFHPLFKIIVAHSIFRRWEKPKERGKKSKNFSANFFWRC